MSNFMRSFSLRRACFVHVSEAGWYEYGRRCGHVAIVQSDNETVDSTGLVMRLQKTQAWSGTHKCGKGFVMSLHFTHSSGVLHHFVQKSSILRILEAGPLPIGGGGNFIDTSHDRYLLFIDQFSTFIMPTPSEGLIWIRIICVSNGIEENNDP